jgi:hypothetical protein
MGNDVSVLTGVVVGVGVLAATKPGYRSFTDMVDGLFREARHSALPPWMNSVFGGTIQRTMRSIVRREVHDCFLFSIGKWETEAQYAVYIGALNTWWMIDNSSNEEE